ncbi:Chemotaxis response regulator protein-glutamate methylesterase [bioreactor metagenome]|uniref:Chemotaxis response regulator protein-glutamate methylesterase n=1 Tax=bioreactor metagenome TaxID=1076179 RepID=A0A644TMB6_9ZZZZ|nr:diguanylate cyclase [Negativicutes bacterium]
MSILVVDDSFDSRLLVRALLKDQGYSDIILAESAAVALEILRSQPTDGHSKVDLILMDLVMPELDGIEACRMFKQDEALQDIPIIMVTASSEVENLERAFAAGAMDFITKPLKRVELLARVRSVLKLKSEMDQRKSREEELRSLTSLDGLTGIANRRCFDEFLEDAWHQALGNHQPLALIMLDIDFFKMYNDAYGHQAGDECLRKVAKTIQSIVNCPFELAARYGGEEFSVILASSDAQYAAQVGEKARIAVVGLNVPHCRSPILPVVTVSVGVASIVPSLQSTAQELIKAADDALYYAKQNGRNQIRIASEVKG